MRLHTLILFEDQGCRFLTTLYVIFRCVSIEKQKIKNATGWPVWASVAVNVLWLIFWTSIAIVCILFYIVQKVNRKTKICSKNGVVRWKLNHLWWWKDCSLLHTIPQSHIRSTAPFLERSLFSFRVRREAISPKPCLDFIPTGFHPPWWISPLVQCRRQFMTRSVDSWSEARIHGASQFTMR